MEFTQENNERRADVGVRLRELRQERRKSMRALARMSGLSTNALSMIERGKTSPSVNTLSKLSGALDIPITAFFRSEPPRQEIVFCKASARGQMLFPNGAWEGLGGEMFVGRMEPLILKFLSGASSGPTGVIHSGHEFVMCLEGQLEFEVDHQRFLLEPGDCLLFLSRLPHRWENPGLTTASAVVVLTGFEADERPSEYHLMAA